NEKEALLAAIKVLKRQNRALSKQGFMDHLAVMFGEELPPWDLERKYQPQNLQVSIQRNLQRDKNNNTGGHLFDPYPCSVKAGTPSFIVLVSGSPFSKQFLSGKKVQRLK
uniref:Uncharacterized protein n=1 Tax=Cyprinus carpio carpio TaxID=630221 RepID=A0A9J8BI46_CYPCA